ncbi:MAG: hypothetical protein HUJ26_01190 [Planctomycetaceae bacterium]|nr:hypothetical protein [Planctomycetaceae bacterium]
MIRTCLAVLLALTTLPLTSSAQTLTANNIGAEWQGINGWAWYIGYSGGDYTNEAAGQEFVASVSGTLTTLEASVDKFLGGAPLIITFHEAVNGRPGSSLGSVSISEENIYNYASEIPTPINTFDVSSANVTVEAGQHYFISFTTPLPATSARYRAILTANNTNSFGYRALYSTDGGETWVYPTITPEIGMRLYVDGTVPPPPPADGVTAVNFGPVWESNFGQAIYIGDIYEPLSIDNEGAAQEFPASQSGVLTTLEASVTKSSGGAPLVVTIYESNNGLPGASLGSVSIPESEISTWNDLPDPPIQPFDLSSANISVEAGRNYIVAFTTPLAGAVRYSARLTSPNDYSFGYGPLRTDDGGATWRTSNSSAEIGVRLLVEASAPPPPVTFEAQIDIQPEDPDNQIQLGKKRPKPVEVVLFGETDFAVSEILVESLALGDPTIADGQPSPPVGSFIDDIDGDGFDDLFLEFDLAEMEFNLSIDAQSLGLILDGMLSTGDFVSGIDFVTISQPGSKGNGNGGEKGNGKGKNKK